MTAVTTSIKPDPSISAKGMQVQLLLGILVAATVFAARGIPFVITSLNDGTHKAHSARHPRSLHYEGLAVDIRLPSRFTNDPGTDAAMKLALQGALGTEFDVVLEGDHFHVEWDPKGGVA